MSLLPCQPVTSILMFTLIIVLANLSSANDQKHRSLYGHNDNDNIVKDPYERNQSLKGGHKSTITLSPEALAKARRTISQLSPGARRFLFSPTIQNTITNLNQNANTNSMEIKNGGVGTGGIIQDPGTILGYINPETGAVEYDLRGKVNKICFTLE